MSHDPNGRIDRQTAERLLRGEPVGLGGLASLIAAAGEPVSPGPLPGEQQALAAFQRAEATRAPRPRRRINSSARSSCLALKCGKALRSASLCRSRLTVEIS